MSGLLVVLLVATGICTCALTSCAPDADPPPLDAAPPSEAGPEVAESEPARDRSESTFRALWVLCEGSHRTLEDPARISRLVDDASALAATDLFVQVYRGGRAWYDATLADAAPYRAIVAKSGADPLASLIAQAHEAGLRVHAWVNVLSLSRNRSAPILQELGRDAVLVDRRGRSLLDYPELEIPEPEAPWYRMGTRGIYLDPGFPGVAERLAATFAELVARYPDLDGLHLDYIRHPGALPFAPGSRFVGLDFGYGAASRLRFGRETGLTGPWPSGGAPAATGVVEVINANAWDRWRRAKVDDLVERIGRETFGRKPELLLSAAVISYADRAYLTLMQDWRGWLDDDLVDFVVPMIYTLDDDLLRYQVESFANGPNARRIWPGLGTWLFARRPAQALAQIEIARAAGAAGEALFSYDAIVDLAPASEEDPSLLEALLGDGEVPPASASPDTGS